MPFSLSPVSIAASGRGKGLLGTSSFLKLDPDDSSVLSSLRQSLESLTLKTCILMILFSYTHAPSVVLVDTYPGLPGWERVSRAEEKAMTEAVGREPRLERNPEEEWSLRAIASTWQD